MYSQLAKCIPFRQSGQGFREKTGSFRKSLKKHAEFGECEINDNRAVYVNLLASPYLQNLYLLPS